MIQILREGAAHRIIGYVPPDAQAISGFIFSGSV